MKVIVCPDKFKGTYSAAQVAQFMAHGIKKASPHANIVELPLADGGEGSLETIIHASGGTFHHAKVKGPLSREVNARWGVLGDQITGVIEMAEASGLQLLATDEYIPTQTHTFGMGQLILHALDYGCKRLLLCIGGSATNDGGTGMAVALGVKFLDALGRELPLGGENLVHLHTIDMSTLDSRLAATDIVVLTDVRNPLCGDQGASVVYGPQKGATAEQIERLDKALYHYGTLLEAHFKMNILHQPGAGAAGGLGAAALTFLNAALKPGCEYILDLLNFDHIIQNADLIITGEGRTDKQTLQGKVPFAVAKRAEMNRVPLVCLSGSLAEGYEEILNQGVTSCFSIIQEPMALEVIIRETPHLLESATEQIIRLFNKRLK